MQQLKFFDDSSEKQSQRKAGRPCSITAEVVFAVKDDIKKGLKNAKIICKYKISERSFYRIKKGEYDNLFEKALENEIDKFELDFCD